MIDDCRLQLNESIKRHKHAISEPKAAAKWTCQAGRAFVTLQASNLSMPCLKEPPHHCCARHAIDLIGMAPNSKPLFDAISSQVARIKTKQNASISEHSRRHDNMDEAKLRQMSACLDVALLFMVKTLGSMKTTKHRGRVRCA